ncbi:MAG TPA: TonB-dependent receptor [Sphingomicrobium sp.]|jgi:iron complex outermembrane receptor protein|nr:TonB-dependent receptor [Sphingomicrobium sp.]
MRPSFIIGACLTCALSSPAAAEAISDAQDLSKLSIEQLAQIPVRSASKAEEPLSTAPAALYVITGKEILNSGVNSLPDALRLAPNLWVQQVDASQYAISARGFNGIESGNKLLVLIDGRSVYAPLASTVYWNLHWPLLEDIKQIEVISGPGGTLYGPNAVNGVINVTSRDARDTLGTMVRATGGALEQTAAIRQGFSLGGSGAVRVYADWHNNDGLPPGTGADVDDDYSGWQGGFRSDFGENADHVTVQGDIFRTDADTFPGDGAKGQNLLARWSHVLNPNSSFEVQSYYDYFKRDFVLAEESVATLDTQAQLNLTRGAHNIVAGGGVRTTKDRFVNNLNPFKLVPESRRLWIYNLFLQDRLSLTPELDLIAGSKIERSSFTGWQVLPNARLAWHPDEQTLLWAAVSRAVRTPSRIDRELEARINGQLILAQSPDFQSEELTAVEVGYRGQPTSTTTISVNGFLNFYDSLRTTEFVNGSFQLLNNRAGRTYGIEAWGTAQLTPWWRLSLGGATLWKDLHLKEGHFDLSPRNVVGNDPNWQAKVESQFDIAPRLQLNLNGRAVGEIEQSPQIGSYVELGGRLAYQLTDKLELYLAGRNLLHQTHAENNDPNTGALAKRSVYGGIRVHF